MILQSLVRLAERQGLLGEPGYATKAVQWIVDVAPDGTPLAIVSTGEAPVGPEGKRPRPTFKSMLIPKRSPSRAATRIEPDCLVDNAQYLLGLVEADKENLDLGRTARCAQASAERTAQVASGTGDPHVVAQLALQEKIAADPSLLSRAWPIGEGKAVDVLHSSGARLRIPRNWASNHLFAVRVAGDLVCRRAAVRQWVGAHTSDDAGGDAAAGVCLVTGKEGPLAALHDKVRLPGDTGPLPLVSFNQRAFEHYGREGNENAPIGRYAANACFQALEHLLSPSSRRSVALSADTTALFWCEASEGGTDPAEDLSGWFATGDGAYDPQEIEATYRKPRTGGRPPLVEDATPFFSLVLTRVKSRVILRTTDLHTVGEVARSVTAFLADTDICRQFRDEPDHRRLRNLIDGTVAAGRRDAAPQAELACRLYRAAIDLRLPFPRELLAAVVGRARSHDKEGISRRRVAVARAVVNRTCRRDTDFRKELPVSLEIDHPSTAYQLGRLFAVLERLQQDATAADAGIGERYLGTAMASPALVFPRLLKLSKHHVAKLEAAEGRRRNWPRLLDDILQRVPPEIPRTQSLVDQGTFLVGYHHQRADLWKPRAEQVLDHAAE